jgi:hypothetical protein
VVGVVFGWEEYHVIAIAKVQELKAPKPDHCASDKGHLGFAIQNFGRNVTSTRSAPYPACQLSVF